MLIDTLSKVEPTATDVLAILKDQHRHQCGCDPEADADVELTFAGPVSQLAPSRLPAIKIHHPRYDRASLASIASFCGTLLALGLPEHAPFLWIPFSVVACACWLWAWHVARYTLPASVTFGELRTVRDLCVALVSGLRG